MSIHRVAPLSAPTAVALLFTVVGRGTDWLARRQEGDVIDLLGPMGHGFDIGPQSHNLLLIAGGIGIAPLFALADEGTHRGLRLTLLLGAPTAAQLYPVELMRRSAHFVVATEDGSAGRKGTVIELSADLADGADQIFACGPVPMYRALAALMQGKKGEKSVQVSMEAMMGCGFGGCYGCAIETKKGPKLVCRDGPVFQLSEIFW